MPSWSELLQSGFGLSEQPLEAALVCHCQTRVAKQFLAMHNHTPLALDMR
jgi:hypothetical protein